MKFIMIVALTLLSSMVSAKDMAAQGTLGFDRGAVNVGGDFDFVMDDQQTLGGYFILGASKDSIRNQFWSLGIDAKIFFGPENWQLYLGPGLGIISADTGSKSEVTFGPLLKVGTLYRITPKVSVGLEHTVLTNWFSDKLVSSVSMTNFVVRFDIPE